MRTDVQTRTDVHDKPTILFYLNKCKYVQTHNKNIFTFAICKTPIKDYLPCLVFVMHKKIQIPPVRSKLVGKKYVGGNRN